MITDIPWDLEILKEKPQAEWLNRTETVHSLLYEGEPFEGDRATEVFAYYASPGTLNADPELDQNLPAIILVHGGGGTAFSQWAEKWATNGYAALAMDLKGSRPSGELCLHGGPTMNHPNIFHTMDASKNQHWCYHGVANVIRAHSLIRSFPEVDSNRTAITGISWGGFLTCIVLGLDDRFKAAIPIYGCGYIYKNGPWLTEFGAMKNEHRDQWIKRYDPSQYLGYCNTPVFFVNGTNDFAYLPDIYDQSYRLVKGPRNFRITLDMEHGHEQGWAPKEIEMFVSQYLTGGVPLPVVHCPIVHLGRRLVASVSAETELFSANLHYTTDTTPYSERRWNTVDAEIDDNTIVANVGTDQKCTSILTVRDERGAIVSSQFVFNGHS
ncbi:hypothetical protein CMK22_03665 [Candidatus Poribacteria bacterium]|nr:hypothetical protein [Candidatus Poribacteria bacterium]